MSNKLVEESFTNEFNQVIQPGDRVVYVVQGYQHGYTAKIGTYLGTTEGHPTVVGSASKKVRYLPDMSRQVNYYDFPKLDDYVTREPGESYCSPRYAEARKRLNEDTAVFNKTLITKIELDDWTKSTLKVDMVYPTS
jgi:hypothetical protein